ncbi:MAG: tetratricopeptide repeat protein [Acidobacteriota bacterium]|nr:tetratricopeptide repeat protein [Acidobacteriota bacterium]
MSPLPVLQDKDSKPPKIARSRTAKWRAGVLVLVHLVIAAHIAHWLMTGSSVTPVEPSEAMAFSKGNMVNAGLIFFAATILLTAVFGRFFCGWACHLVALQDLCRWLLGKVGIKPAPLRSRVLLWVPLLAFVYMFLWPVAYRLWIGDSFQHLGFEMTTSEFWATFPGWVVGGLTFLTCGFVIVYFLGAKGFCTYACPYGAIYGLADKVSPMRIRVTDACAGCGHCTAVCSSNVRVHQEVRDYGMVVDPGCMKCMDCVSVCPNDALYYGAGPISLGAKPRVEEPRRQGPQLSWGQEGVLAVAFAAAFFTFRGLYGAVPFLMSLGLAAVLAYLTLFAVKLASRRAMAFRGWRLKREGKLLPAGWVVVSLLGVVGIFWVHSAVVRGHAALGERAYRSAAPWRTALDVTAPVPAVGSAERERVLDARDHLIKAQNWGLVKSPTTAAKLAYLEMQAGFSREVEAHAEEALAGGEDAASMEQLLARVAWSRGEEARAKEAYRRALEAAPERPGAYVNLGILLGQSGDLAGAGEVLEEGLRRAPATPSLTYNAGLVKAMTGDVDGAVARFQAALEAQPELREARENLAGVLASAGRFEAAVEQFRIALAQAPEDVETRFLLARALLGAGSSAAAAAELREVLRRSPGHAGAEQLLRQVEARE